MSSSTSDATVEDGPLDLAVLFVDLIGSSEFASVLGLREYAQYVDSFEAVCREQCRHYFEVYLEGKYQYGRDYELQAIGDELVVFMHTGKPRNDVYQLLCLAIALKCGWLGVPLNAQRIASGMASAELAAGVHFGKVWARRTDAGYHKRGFAINLAKRTESASRDGERFRVFVTDPAFKQVNRRMRNLIFGPRQVLAMKGVLIPVGVYEVFESFVDPGERLAPAFAASFNSVAREALAANSFDLWIHSCLQVYEERQRKCVSDECVMLCENVLRIDPRNAVALYYAGQGAQERGALETAALYLSDLVRFWPALADGWLEYGRLLKRQGRLVEARTALLQARRNGVSNEEEELPEV